MCGIAGVLTAAATIADRCAVEAALRVMRSRGPDGEGLSWIPMHGGEAVRLRLPDTPSGVPVLEKSDELYTGQKGAFFGHRRLSVIDLSIAGHQPMEYADSKLCLSFNGEIYNYQELRRELSGRHEFRTDTDTEVVLAAWAEWGPTCLRRFVGMFAFALADLRGVGPRIFLARDPFGIKPLYWGSRAGGLAFASEPKGLLAMGLDRRVNASRLYQFLVSGVSDYGDESMFGGIQQVPPGCYTELGCEGLCEVEYRRYWDVSKVRQSSMGRSDAVAAVRAEFLSNVRLHIRSDVPVGTALSGGIDSSAVVGAVRACGSDSDLRAFSFIAEDEILSEEKWIDMAADRSGAICYKITPSADELCADLDDLVRVQDEPFVSTSMYAQYRVFRLASENGVKVMLDGQGADELMAGYASYPAARMAGLLVRGQWVAAARFLSQARYAVGGGGAKMAINAIGQLVPNALKSLTRKMRGGVDEVINFEWFTGRGVGARNWLNRSTRRDMLHEELIRALTMTSLPKLLRYEDRNSMAFSVESRVPFLTTGFAELLLSLPDECLVANDGTSKSIFREAMRGIVPDGILDRRDKVGFATPEMRWLLHLRPWVEARLNSDTARDLPMVRGGRLRRQWDEVVSGTKPFDGRFWRWISVIAWIERNGVELK
jgi:asparagine synthase (glutamine-hydrolysing)